MTIGLNHPLINTDNDTDAAADDVIYRLKKAWGQVRSANCSARSSIPSQRAPNGQLIALITLTTLVI